MQSFPRIAIVGATGAVGQVLIQLLEQRSFPVDSLKLFASSKSAGRPIFFRGKPICVEPLSENSFEETDLCFFAAGGDIAKKFAPIAAAKGVIVIDKSSAFRMHPEVPLVIPEINAGALGRHQGIIANPNCTATIMLMAIAPLHRKNRIRRIVASTYQAASGAGAEAVEELWGESRAIIEKKDYMRKVFSQQYAFNVFTHNSPLSENGYVEEEVKLAEETRKILNDPEIRVSATCVRVPTFRSHAEALNIEFTEPMEVDEAYSILSASPGLMLYENRENGLFASPIDAEGRNEILFGRLRKDLSHSHCLEMWVVGDQLLKGAALNAVQIAETLIK
jgi:aspartate-semialdehyde dehydrogenase